MFHSIAYDWNRTWVLMCWKQPLCQPCPEHCPIKYKYSLHLFCVCIVDLTSQNLSCLFVIYIYSPTISTGSFLKERQNKSFFLILLQPFQRQERHSKNSPLLSFSLALTQSHLSYLGLIPIISLMVLLSNLIRDVHQCDQIGLLLKSLKTYSLTKLAQIFGNFIFMFYIKS